MDERRMQFLVGVVFLATVLFILILLTLFGGLPSLIGYYDIQILLSDASGVSKDTPVRKSGLVIGRVDSVRLIDKDSKALVTAKIQGDKVIYQNEDCWVARNLLSGDTSLSFVPNPNKPGAGKPINRDTPLEGRISEDPTGVKTVLEDALRSPINTVNTTGKALREASEELGKAAHKVGALFDEKTQADLKTVLEGAADALKVLGKKENQAKLAEALNDLPNTLKGMNSTFQRTNEMLDQFTQHRRRRQDAGQTHGGHDRADRADAAQVQRAGTRGRTGPHRTDRQGHGESQRHHQRHPNHRLADRPRPRIAGALMNDRQLYDRLNHAARNIEEVSQKLKPIVDDAACFLRQDRSPSRGDRPRRDETGDRD